MNKMVDSQLLKDAVEIGGTVWIYAHLLDYVIKAVMHPRIKSDLEKLVDSGEMKKEDADYRMDAWKKYVLLPWPIGGFYLLGKMKRYYNNAQKGDPHF